MTESTHETSHPGQPPQGPKPQALKTARRKRFVLFGIGGAAALFLALQLVPVSGLDNPPVVAAFDESAEVKAILKRSCYDCHSNESQWPWYTKVAPASWLVARDVVEGRKALNFSDWPEDEDDRQFSREQSWEEVAEGEMPLWFYLPLHPEARLSEQDLATLKRWATAKKDAE